MTQKLEEARKLYQTANADQRYVLESLFPELAESEDEKIRKGLIKAVSRTFEGNTLFGTDVTREEALAWLEKQGEKNPFDYENATIQQKDFAPKEVIPRYSIGDVLCDKSCTTLSKNNQPNFEITDIRNGLYICDKCSLPISQQDEYELVAKRIEQNPAEWNVDDKSIISDLLDYFDEDKCLKHEVNDIVKWLKSIKTQQKHGWSGNEANMLDNLITYLNGRKDLLEEIKGTYISWLKSLKDRYTWKPSDEQMEALQYVYRSCNPLPSDKLGWDSIRTLELMYQELKKLREE